MVDQARLVDELYTFARKLVTDYPVTDALHDLVEASTSILGIVGAGVSLAHGGRLSFAVAGSADVVTLEEVQERGQAGPGIEAFHDNKVVLVADLKHEPQRWPALTEASLERGIDSIAGIPLRLNGTPLGAVNLYDAQRSWTEDDVQTAELVAALAAGYLANATRLDEVRHTTEQLQHALESRVVIEQAKGMVAAERRISVDAAFELIRAHARSHGAPLHDVARAVVELGFRP